MADNKKNILDCALDLFWAKGYASVGVQEIVEAAGVTKPTLYHYFGNKEGLLQELISEGSSKLLASVSNAASYSGDLPLTLYKVTSSYFSFAQNNPKFYRIIMSTMFYPPESEPFKITSPFTNTQVSILQEMFLKASNDHGNMKGRHTTYAFTFLGMINTYIELYYRNAVNLNDEVTFKAIHQFMHGIYS